MLRLLEMLKDDPERMVQRSVANNLNDIAKDSPDLVIETLERWQPGASENVQWIIRHASRTLIKQGKQGALGLLGYEPGVRETVPALRVLTPVVRFGEALAFEFEVRSEADAAQNLMIDFVIHHVKANGKRAPKVFKLARKRLEPGDSVAMRKSYPMRPISTRMYYPGTHLLEIQINGQICAQAEFALEMGYR